MAETFAYDAVSFLRVVYLRRFFILKGTIAVTFLVAIASLIWPQTWRANASVFVSTPKFKQSLMLFPEQPFDVKTYEGIMRSDSLYFEIISTIQWLHESIHELLDTDKIDRLKSNLPGKAERLNRFELVQNTNQPLLTELLLDGEEAQNPAMKNRIAVLGNLGADEIEEIYRMSAGEIDDLTVFSLRRNLSAGVAVIKETNLETIYSNSIQISAEAGTAVGSKLLANLWIKLFINRAENTVRSIMQNQIDFTKQRAADIEVTLASAEQTLNDFLKEAPIDTLESELASKRVALTGMSQQRLKTHSKEQDFDLENENENFMDQTTSTNEHTTFVMTSNYENALIPQLIRVRQQIETLQSFLPQPPGIISNVSNVSDVNVGNAPPGIVSNMQDDGVSRDNTVDIDNDRLKTILEKLSDLTHEKASLEKQISTVQSDIKTLEHSIQTFRAQREVLSRKHEQALNQWQSIQSLLAEVALLESQGTEMRFADVSPDYAIKPDKRIWPRRSLMVLAGGAGGFLLFLGLAFFLNIWNEVVNPGNPE